MDMIQQKQEVMAMQLTDDSMWAAVAACDPACDGEFLYAVRTTGICCRPSCPSRTPRRGNVVYFGTAAEARAAGYRACKRCRPFGMEEAGEADAVRLAQEMLERAFREPVTLQRLARQSGLSKDHLQRRFKAAVGLSPAAYTAELRLGEAARLLACTGKSVTDIAYEVGYRSLSQFALRFRRRYGCTPGDYRKTRQEGESGHESVLAR